MQSIGFNTTSMNTSGLAFGLTAKQRKALQLKAESDRNVNRNGGKKIATTAFVPTGSHSSKPHRK